jgi:hypothetical protein
VPCAITDPACGVPLNASVRLSVDRPLLPSTVIRQNIRVYTGIPENAAPFVTPRYDLLTREVNFDFARPLQPKTLYQVELGGLRAFDGAPLADEDATARWSFVTSEGADPALEPAVPTVEPSCGQVVERLSGSCGGAACHGGDEPAMGLRLETIDDLVRTAIDRVAHQTETGDRVGTPFDAPRRFGVAMPRIEPASPHNSYLVYKLLLLPENAAPCAAAACAPFAALPGADHCDVLPELERRRLAEWFVLGDPMPLPRDPSGARHPGSTLDCGTLRALTRWIANGARCD